MTFFLIFSAFVLLVHLSFILFATSKIESPVKVNRQTKSRQQFSYSIIIPFRNEIRNLTNILSDLKQLNFNRNRFEVIFIDDDSMDGSFELLDKEDFSDNFKLIKAINRGKKQAIKQAISLASGNYIYTIDADCRLHPDILQQADEIIEIFLPTLLVQPVISENKNHLLFKFQYYDYLSLMGINAAVDNLKGQPAIASAANLIFSKEAFDTIMPFEDNLNISSGDDMFLLQSFLKDDPQSVILNYSADSLITTKPELSWFALFKQRIRWTGKMKRFSGSISFFLGMLTVAVQVVLMTLLAIGICNNLFYLLYFMGFWFLKSWIDFIFLNKTAVLLGQKANWISVFILEPVYMIFVPSILLLSLFVHPQWKGRKIVN
jgi:glycosyltransferase involved in cell wall biosynthesis